MYIYIGGRAFYWEGVLAGVLAMTPNDQMTQLSKRAVF